MRTLILFVFLNSYSWAAITSNTVWNVQHGSSNTNGCAFDSTISGAGTDMSTFVNKNAASCTSCQSATVNISTTDAVTANTTTVTSATGNFSSALIGNMLYLSGSGTTTGRYQVTAVGSATSVTVDRATGGAGGTAQTMNIGGTCADPSEPGTSARGAVAGNVVNIKANATYTFSSSASYTVAGSAGLPILFRGYTTTVGDGGQATIQASSTNLNLISSPGSLVWFQDLIVDCNAQATTKGFSLGNNHNRLTNVLVENCASSTGSNIAAGGNELEMYNVVVKGATAAATGGAMTMSAGEATCVVCRFTGNAAPAVVIGSGSLSCSSCIFDNNTGASSDGLQIQTTADTQPIICNFCDFYLNGRDGIRITTANGATALSVHNSIIEANVGVGINSTVTNWVQQAGGPALDYNAFFNNGTARTNVSAGAHDVAYSSTAFVGGGSNNFALSSAGITALQNLGLPGVISTGGTSSGTGYATIGALQPQVTSGSGATVGYPIQ